MLKDGADGDQFKPDMPPLDIGEYLLEHFWAVGPTLSGGMGDGPLTHCELRAYQDNTGVELSEWEVFTLRRLSIEYLNELQRATKRNCPAPWQQSGEVLVLAAADTRNALRELAKL